MEITSLAKLMEERGVVCMPRGLNVTIHPSWIVEGEDRLSYTTLLRIIECCREYHWQTDVLPRIQSGSLDSICRSITATFMKPILVGRMVSIVYQVTGVHEKGYSLRFSVYDTMNQTLCAEVDLISVFYEPTARRSIPPPTAVYEYLTRVKDQS